MIDISTVSEEEFGVTSLTDNDTGALPKGNLFIWEGDSDYLTRVTIGEDGIAREFRCATISNSSMVKLATDKEASLINWMGDHNSRDVYADYRTYEPVFDITNHIPVGRFSLIPKFGKSFSVLFYTEDYKFFSSKYSTTVRRKLALRIASKSLSAPSSGVCEEAALRVIIIFMERFYGGLGAVTYYSGALTPNSCSLLCTPKDIHLPNKKLQNFRVKFNKHKNATTRQYGYRTASGYWNRGGVSWREDVIEEDVTLAEFKGMYAERGAIEIEWTGSIMEDKTFPPYLSDVYIFQGKLYPTVKPGAPDNAAEVVAAFLGVLPSDISLDMK